MRNSTKKKWSILLLILMYLSSCGNSLNAGVTEWKAFLYNFIGIVVITLIMSAVPFFYYKENGSRLDRKTGKSVCFWNSVVLFIISLLLMPIIGYLALGGLGAVLFYFINKWWFVDETKTSIKSNTPKTLKCSNCGQMIDDEAEYCSNCGSLFVSEERLANDKKRGKKNDIEEIDEDFVCSNCGKPANDSDIKCKYCGARFKEEQEETIMVDVFVCSNCGNEVKITDTKCKNCGATFGDEIDKKSSDLRRLKKLYDEGVLTKREFQKEKNKILKNDY